jgi:DNA-binding response OmpR family regulator
MSRILVIEDQQDVRAMICMVLRVNHFEVIDAPSAAAGLKFFEESNFDVAIVDVFLDDANGFDVVARMRSRVPDMPVVVMSGMTSMATVSPSADLPDLVCLQKPFRPNELIGAIQAAKDAVGRSTDCASAARAVV